MSLSFYSNIPIIATLSIIKDYVHNNDQFTKKTSIAQEKFLDLIHLALRTTWYTFNFQLYQKTDSVAIGGPASSTTVEIYMFTHKHTAISTALHPPTVWQLFVHNFHPNIKFTMEETK